MSTRRTTHEQLARAAKALADARARHEDPWRVEELRLRHEALLEAALDAEADGRGLQLAEVAPYPTARRPEPPLPLAWVDESGRARTPGRGEPS